MKDITEYRGFWIKTEQDEDATPPRENDNIGTMVCSHRRYILGDIQDMCEDEFDIIRNSSDYISLPIYMYEHSGITISTKPFSCPWDSGLVGMIYCSMKEAETAYVDLYPEDELRKIVEEVLQEEVKEYDQYLTGDVWCYSVYDKNPEENEDAIPLDSCCGFYGEEHCLEMAREFIDYRANEKLKEFIPGMEPEELKKGTGNGN